jgi:hypothetical protein
MLAYHHLEVALANQPAHGINGGLGLASDLKALQPGVEDCLSSL